jgi:hypothetical protein
MLHYLPLFIAHEELRDELDIEIAPSPHGDKSAIASLMSITARDKDVHFCVCDPMMVSLEDAYSAVGGDEPVVIGQIVGKVPFWAVNHQNRAFNETKHFGDFDQVFTYPKPNTGYIFGKLVTAPFPGRGENFFRPEKPIGADLGHYLTGKSSVVIEADILNIRKYVEETDNKIVYSFARDPEYKEFCFTALLSSKNFLRTDQGRGQAQKLLEALVRATDLIYTHNDLVLDFALSRFKDYTSEVITGALSMLIDEDIFSRDARVRQEGWENSGHIRRQLEEQFKFPSFRRYVDNRIASKVFSAFLKSKTKDSGFLFLHVSRLINAWHKIAPLLVFAIFYLWPFLLLRRCHHSFDILGDPWFLFHGILTTLLLGIYGFRAFLSHLLKINPAKWLEWGGGLGVGYICGEIIIVLELLRGFCGK